MEMNHAGELQVAAFAGMVGTGGTYFLAVGASGAV
jgi:hypothetical protein